MRKLNNILNKYFYILLTLTMAIDFVANYQGTSMSGILHCYIDFARLIKSGFNINIEYPTFPMWGYGFIYAITNNKFIIIFLQFCTTFFTIYIIDQFVQKIFKNNDIKTLFRLFLIVSFPWFSFNSILWPYSIAANFTVLSLIFIYKYFDENKNYYLFISACLFGIVLNFRSDYYLYPLFLAFLLFCYKIYSWKNKFPVKIKIQYIGIWLILIYSFLIPYAIYTKATIGHYLITSTNTGHVCFIGLGQLPNNKWGITPYDEDPKMDEIMKEEFEQESYNRSIQYDGDKVLKKRFLDIIKKDPKEYLKKDFYSAYLMLKGGFYCGEYEKWAISSNNKIDEIHTNVKKFLKRMDVINILKILKHEGLFFSLLYIFHKLLNVYGKILFLCFNLSILFILYYRLYRENYFLSIIFLSIIFYQFALCIFVYYMPIYITNLYLIYLFFIFLTIDYYAKNKKIKNFLED